MEPHKEIDTAMRCCGYTIYRNPEFQVYSGLIHVTWACPECGTTKTQLLEINPDEAK